MATTSIIQTLSKFSIFKGFTPHEIWDILAAGQVTELHPGTTLLSPGSKNDTLYLLITGELGVILEKDGVEVAIPIPPGECLGEMSLIGGNPTSARVITRKLSRVLLISEETFWSKLALTRSGVQNLMEMMALRLKRNNAALIEKVEQQWKYQLMQKELETAGKIQSSIVPIGNALFPNCPQVDAYALINQARDVGGDFYDALVLDKEHLYFAIGDVSGKGIPAALFMMRTINSLRLFLHNQKDFSEVLPAVNNWLARDNEDMMFVSLFAGMLNLKTGTLRYVNAGHNPPLVSQSRGLYRSMSLPKGRLVGILPDSDFPVTEVQLNPGDAVVLYTDGITEAKNANGIMFDVDRTLAALNREDYPTMKGLVENLETEVETFVGSAPQFDDYTILGLGWIGG